jgi:hypothetical protein
VGAHNSGTTEDDIDVQVRCADFAPAHIP